MKIKCPIDEAQQQWTYMAPEIKSNLKRNITEVCAEFGMGEILMQSFSI